jgi:hypothetical protein
MDDRRIDQAGGGIVMPSDGELLVAVLDGAAVCGAAFYLFGLFAALSAVYVLPASHFSLILYLGGVAIFFVSNVAVIGFSMASQLVALWNGRRRFNRSTILLLISVVAMAIWLILVRYVWP